MLKNKSIVHIIDDDLSIGKALGRLFKSVDIEYEYFTSAEAYLKSDTKKDAHCLILDVKLPGMSGLDLQQELKKQNNNIAIIFITGQGDKELEEEVINKGAYGYLEKPFDHQLLIELIESSLEKGVVN